MEVSSKTDFLYPYQLDAVNRLSDGCILCGSVGSGKSRTGLFYYFKENGGWIDKDKYTSMKNPQDLYIITTAKNICWLPIAIPTSTSSSTTARW